MQKFTRSLIVLSVTLALGACSTISGIFGSSESETSKFAPRTTAMAINGFLWQATLETLSFMPIDQVEASGGIIVTDWYSTSEAPNERVKVAVRFLTQALRSDGFKVSVARQELRTGNWISVPVEASTELQIEEAILTAARRMRLDENT